MDTVLSSKPAIRGVTAAAYSIPTDAPEADGTFAWSRTTLVVAEVAAGGESGLGYSYGHKAQVALIATTLAEAVAGRDALDIAGAWQAMRHAVRNLGQVGLAAMAIAAVDAALWDLKGKLLGQSVATLLGRRRDSVPLYGSGGFTSYTPQQLAKQLAGWADQGLPWVKMKIGSDPEQDLARVRQARAAIGRKTGLFVDANGAYSAKQALAFADRFAEEQVSWFEEPVSSDHLDQLRLIRARAPDGMEIAAGEYGYDSFYFRRMLDAEAVDVLQADATRCGGLTGFLEVGALCAARGLDLSAHTAPALHLHACCAVPRLRHLEWFHDHVRIEAMLFDGAPVPEEGSIRPDLARPGLGLDFKRADAARYGE
jgi:L-alanine-DL-glutamate epimerase-like enolase superfamily enzyme